MEVKLFTLEGIKVTLIHNLILLGALAAWVFINVQVLGNDVEFGGSARASSAARR